MFGPLGCEFVPQPGDSLFGLSPCNHMVQWSGLDATEHLAEAPDAEAAEEPGIEEPPGAPLSGD